MGTQPLDRKVGFSPSDIVLDGDLALPSPKGDGALQFSARVYCGLDGWMDQYATWHSGRC